MRNKIVVVILAALFVVGHAPVAAAGPGSAICRASQNAYETATGKRAPWECLY